MATPIYPKNRGLTSGEIKMLKEIYGNSIDYGKIQIKSGYVPNGAEAYVPTRNAIIFNKNGSSLSLDYSATNESDSNRAQFIHEVGHIWQRQSGVGVTAEKFKLKMSGIKDEYTYTLSAGKKLTDYNIEQQAEIISDYYMLKHQKMRYYEGSPKVSNADLLKNYENVMEEFLKDPNFLKKKLQEKSNESENIDSVSTDPNKKFSQTGKDTGKIKTDSDNSSQRPSMKNLIFPRQVWEELGFKTEGKGQVIRGQDSQGNTKQYVGYSADSVRITSGASEQDPVKAGQDYISDKYNEYKRNMARENTRQVGAEPG